MGTGQLDSRWNTLKPLTLHLFYCFLSFFLTTPNDSSTYQTKRKIVMHLPIISNKTIDYATHTHTKTTTKAPSIYFF